MTNPKTSPVAESVTRLRGDSALASAVELWFFNDLGETQRRQLFNCCGFPGVEANGEDLQRSLLTELFRGMAIAAMPRSIEDDTPTDAGEVPFTRLVADYLPEGEYENQEPGWRIHDFPEGTYIANWLAGGLEEAQAKFIVEAVNARLAHPTPTDTGLVGELVEAAGYDPLGFVAEARMHAKDMPCVIQRDYLNAALDKLERIGTVLSKAKDQAHG